MKIIDLTLPLYTGMPVYPGDPEAVIEVVKTIADGGWEMRRLEINSHDGTHVNVPSHSVSGGKNLGDYDLSAFMGDAVLFEGEGDIKEGVGVIFHKHDITQEIAELIVQKEPKFVGLSSNFEFNEDVEKFLLNEGVISYERLANTEQLPKTFYFHGVPLNIPKGDGSPVRAYATVQI